MRKSIARFLVAMFFLMIGGSAYAAGTERCESVIAHILSIAARNDIAVAKLLVDFAADDAQALGCNDEQLGTLKQLLQRIYLVYISDHLTAAKDDILVRKDGRSAYRNIILAINAAREIELDIRGIEGLAAMALFTASGQFLHEARDAEREGDLDLRDSLREQAVQLLREAIKMDPRIEQLLKNSHEQQL